MFKIAKSNLATPFLPGSLDVNEADRDLLSQFCVTEGWVADLSNGIITLGERSLAMHGLSQAECGLLSLVRCYEARDRLRILELFEQAAATSSSFCYSTTIMSGAGHRQPVFCVGESSGMEQRYSGSLIGIFLFPRFKLEPFIHIISREQ